MSDARRPIKLLLDENLSPWVARQLCILGVDAAHVNERGLMGATDAQVLERAFAEDRVVVTLNVADFEKLCTSREVHAGVVLITKSGLLRDEQLALLRRITKLLAKEPDMVNRALEIDATGRNKLHKLP